MEVKAYFKNIHKIILKHINAAEREINVAVAWFTDRELFDALCRKAQQGVAVSVVLIDDEINRAPGKLNFIRLQNLKAKVHFIEQQRSAKMHHKFCVIDQSIVITGSYNWTHQARENEENITVIKDAPILINDFLEIFTELTSSDSSPSAIQISSDMVRRRLEMIKNLILLDEIEDVPSHTQKLKPASELYKLDSILQCLASGKYQQAVEEIAEYLKRFTAIVISDDYEAAELKFELKILELRLESLTNEQADLERSILLFNRKQYEILGDITEQILRIKKEYLRLLAEKARKQAENETIIEEKEQEADQAEQTYREYAEEHEEIKQTTVDSLNEEQEQELKQMFRKSCNLCHPDKVPEELKEQAHEIFIELKEAYDNNDLKTVKEIYQRLKSGNFTQTKSSTLKAIDVLRSTISELRYKIEKILDTLRKLNAEPVIVVLNRIGYAEAEWESYLKQHRQSLEQQLEEWQNKLEMLTNDDKKNDVKSKKKLFFFF